MKPRSNALHHGLYVFCQMLLIVALCASCVPFSPAAPISSQPDRASPSVESNPAVKVAPFPVARPISDRSLAAPVAPAPVENFQPASPLNSAYVRDVDLGDGRRQAVVSQTPINYQAADGTWLPIDPRFEAVPRGFVNKRNSFEIVAGDRQAALRLRSGNNLIGWAAQAVALTAPDGGEALLATPLSAEQAITGTLAADGRTIRYLNNWTLPGLAEEITSAPGQVEQNLVFAQRPSPAASNEGQALTLLATLHLLPGAQLFANGKTQTTAFATDGSVEIHDAQGTPILALAPALAFEQANPAQRVAAHYRLTPQAGGAWQVAVDTPYAWWADPARVYPVVLDPSIVMGVLRPFEATNYTNSGGVCILPLESGDSYSPSAAVGAWYGCPAVYRAFIRFDLPTLPHGYQLTKAELLAAPTRGSYVPQSSGIRKASANVELRRVTSAWVNWYTQTDGNTIDGVKQIDVYDSSARSQLYNPYDFTSWILPNSMVNDWLTYPITKNFGLRLSLRPEDESYCIGNPGTCDQYIEIPMTNNQWTEHDKDLAVGGNLPLVGSEQGGFMLLLTYDPLYLQDGVTQVIDVFPTPIGEDYLDPYHTYMAPDISTYLSAWMVAGVKGFNGSAPAGSLSLGSKGTEIVSGDEGKPNYLLFPAGDNERVYVYAPTGTPMPDEYRIEARGSAQLPGNPTIEPFHVYTHTFAMSSTQLLRVFDLNLAEKTNVQVKITPLGGDVSSGDVKAKIYPPGGWTTFRGSSSYSADSFYVERGQDGIWALVIEYDGPWLNMYGLPFSFNVKIEVKACPPGYDFAPAPCNCSVNRPPDNDTPKKLIGDFYVYAENDFELTATGWKTNIPDASCVTPMIGWKTGGKVSLVAVSEAPLTYVTSEGRLYGSSDSSVSLIKFPSDSNGEPKTKLWKGYFIGYADSGSSGQKGFLIPGGVSYNELVVLDDVDMNTASFKVDVQQQLVKGVATLNRRTAPVSAQPQPFAFNLEFDVRAEGFDDPSFVYTATRQSGPSQVDVASLELHLGNDWGIDFDPARHQFTTLRNHDSTIVQPVELGSAWQDIQAVILSDQASRQMEDDGLLYCPAGYCLEPRAPDDALGNLNREWDMPDITITDNAQTVMFSRPGELRVMSTDHPNATSSADGLPFSFRTFSGKVTLSKGLCGGTSEVDIIAGTTNMAMPGLGSDTDSETMLAVDFVLCQNKLHQIKVALEGIQPPLPVGNTGVFVDGVTMDITLDPSYATVSFTIDYVSGLTAELVDGSGTVTIDTRGLFDLQTTGKVLGIVDYTGHVWVAWDPLDVGVEVTIDYLGGFITGQAYAHLWKGQGWQHKYSWLPDNPDELHFAGRLSASIQIKTGMMYEAWWISIPPVDVPLGGYDMAFGQFCSNDGCSDYEWGLKATFSAWYTLGYDVGLYVRLDDDPGFNDVDFILGSDGYVLIDQAGSASALDVSLPESERPSTQPLINGKPAGLNVKTVDATAETITEPMTITANTGSFIAGISWDQGAPQFTLIRPDGLEITPDNAVANGINVTHTTGIVSGTILYGGQTPTVTVGIWLLKVSNATEQDGYHVFYFANKKPPTPVTFSAPVVNHRYATNAITYTIKWSAPPDSPLGISLFYSITGNTVLTPDQKYSGVIVEHLPITATQFDWNMSYLTSGTYHVYGIVSEPQLAAAGGLTQTRPYSLTSQALGITIVRAPGTISITDVIPPVVPTYVFTDETSLKNAIMTCWPPNPDHDLSGYVVQYRTQDWQGTWQTRTLRVHATIPYPPTPYNQEECARISGLNGDNEVASRLAAYDASRNLSAYSPWITKTVSASGFDTASTPGSFAAALGVGNSVVLTWTGLLPICMAGNPCKGAFWVFYAREKAAGPSQPGSGATGGPSPIRVIQRINNTHNYTVQGLTPGYRYNFALQKQDDYGRRSDLTDNLVVLVSDRVDADHDGMFDDWERAHDVTGPNDDPDRDGLTNLEEYRLGTDPHDSNTDNDMLSDGEEYVSGSDPLDSGSISMTAIISGVVPLPRLSLSTERLTFRAYEGGPNPTRQVVHATNTGGKVLTATWTSNTAWLSMSSTFPCRLGDPNCKVIQINKSGLAAGRYTGMITVTGAAGSHTQDSPQQITVNLWVSKGSLPQYLYLPVMRR